MKLYRVHLYQADGQSLGFEWFKNREEAQKFANQYMLDNPHAVPPDIRKVVFGLTVDKMMDFLTRYASHPDNG